MKRFLFLSILVALLLCGGSFLKKEKTKVIYEDQWSGDIYFSYTMVDQGKMQEDKSKSEWKNFRDASMYIHINNNKGRAYVTDVLSKWQRITVEERNAGSVQTTKHSEVGGGSGDIVVWVEMNRETGKYWLKTDGPDYSVQEEDSLIQTFAGTKIIESGGTGTMEKNGFPIDAPDQPIGNNPNEVKGSYVIFSSRTHHVTVSWDLKKTVRSQGQIKPKTQNSNSNPNSNQNSNPNSNSSSNSNSNPNSNPNQTQQDQRSLEELIVTPEHYEDFLPTAGNNMTVPGNTMKISLELRGINGTPLTSRAVNFELRLFSTTSGGVTSNTGTDPPDLRFQSQNSAVISEEGQFVTMPCIDGRTGSALIGSYHQPASTILVAVAILQDGRRIKGNLLKSGGPTEIPIPKTITQ
jgi:hypothetical protein